MSDNGYDIKEDLTIKECENDETLNAFPASEQNYISNIDIQEIGESGTSGTASSDTHFFHSLPQDMDIFRHVILELSKLHNPISQKNILRLLLSFQKVFLIQKRHFDFSGYLPPLHLQQQEDGSILLEWIFKNFRIGFSIELDDQESSWYLVSDSTLNEASESGQLDLNKIDSLLYELIPFVLKNV